jgi:dTDP-4-amino-4,6-dideoxygalactose transaminase
MKVPFLDLKVQHSSLREEIRAAIDSVIEESAFSGGRFVDEFEKEFAAYCDRPFALGVNSGTDALWLALLAFGVEPGDEVITVPNSFMATAEAITYCGAKPVFVDVDEQTYTMNPDELERALTPRTKAIIPVHLYGHPADMDPILEFARAHGLPVIEDACQAHGAEYKGRRVGSLGDAGCFSFYPGKNLGAMGEAGAVVTGDPNIQAVMRTLRDHGQVKKYHHVMVGWNCRMDGIQAVVLRTKLAFLDQYNHLRRTHSEVYSNAFDELEGIVTPIEQDYARHVYHVYAVRVQNREAVMQVLGASQIGYAIHYPVPIHLQKAYKSLGYTLGSFPVAERHAGELLSLPVFPELTSGQRDWVIDSVKRGIAEAAWQSVEMPPHRG